MKKISIIFSLATFLCLFSLSGFGQANFSASPLSGCAPLTVNFTDLSVGATSWSWDLGNGNNTTSQNPSALYNAVGDYTVILTINGGSTHTEIIHVYASPIASFNADNDTTCENNALTFTSTSTQGSAAITTYTWSFGDGNVETGGSTISHVYTLAGNYTVNLIVIDGNNCQSQSSNFTIVVVPAPLAGFTLNPASSCIVPQSVSFTNTTNPPANSYLWTFGDPSSGSADTSILANPPPHLYNVNGSYTITLIATTGNCVNTSTHTFVASPIAAGFTFLPDSICRYDTIFFTNTTVPPPALTTWNFGDPASLSFNTSNLTDPYHVYGSSGWFTVTMIADVGNGCTDSYTDSVYVRPQPVFSLFTTDDSTLCNVPATIHFQSTGDANINQWFWDFGDAGTADTSVQHNPNYTYTAFGNYTVQLIATNIFGCSDTIIKPNYIQIQAPTVTITTAPDSGCANTDQFSFNAVSTNVSGDTTSVYSWNFGDGTTLNNGPNVTHTYTQCNDYNVSVTITTSGGCTATDTRPGLVRTGFPPTADFTWIPSIMCYNDTTQFTDASTANGCPVTGWSWDFGSLEKDPFHVFPDTGVYDVTLVAYSKGCPDTMLKTQIITIHPPKAIFTYYYNCTNPYQVQFYDTSHGDELVVWNFGDGITDATNAQSIIHTYATRGQYQVLLHAYNFTFGCDDSTTQTINIYDPVANIAVSSGQGCHPFTANFNGAGSQDALTFAWDFGDPASGVLNTSTLPSPSHTFNTTGFFTVTLEITDPHGCTADTTYIVHAVGPEASFTSPDTTGCRPFTASFNSTSTTEGSSISQYIWNFSYPGNNDIDTTTSGNATHNYANLGLYSVSLTVIDANGCRDSTVNNSFINVTFPVPQFSGVDTFICDSTVNPYTVNVIGTGPFDYEWNFGDGSAPVINSNIAASSNTESHTYYQNNQVYQLQVKVTDVNGCDTTITQPITVLRPSPVFTVTQADSCGYTRAFFNGPNTDSIYAWVWHPNGPFGYTGISPAEDPEFNFTIPGYYGASLTVTNPGCSVTTTVDSLIFVPGPQSYFDYPPVTHCPPIDVTFTSHLVSGTYNYIQWDFGDGSISQTLAPDSVVTHTYYADGVYNPTAQIAYTLANGRVCLYSDTNLTGAQIVVSSNLSVDITQDTILLTEGLSDTLTSLLSTTVNDPPYTYQWTLFPGSELLSIYNVNSAIYSSAEGDTAIILVVTDNSGCQARDTVYIVIKLCEQDLKIPNVFTPGGDKYSDDGKNDTYYIKDLCPIDDFRITIYNRWGNIVYESTDYGFHWDGVDDNGKDCAEGVYYSFDTGQEKLNLI
ncbi:MAG: PKD domain-containing protein [Bacteroidetes bacterium]|nr:PKD domain-containing protein [Bacteroidota bacterium]